MMIFKKQRLLPSLAGIGMLLVLLLSLPGQVFSQNLKTVTGRVTDAGDPLPGATIKVKGTARGTTTLQNGTFSIQAANNETLVIGFLGMKTQELVVGDRTTINVALDAESSVLNEVVVVGYGSVAKKDLTGAVGVVDVEDLNKAPVGSFAQALAGRVAGVQASSVDGQPGGGVNIIIRGAGSLTQSTTPLYVIDGMPIEGLTPESLNPEEIESMTILKDASSTAIYGSRAGNGVILIQTKRGKVGKPVLSFSSSYGIQGTPKQIELMSPYEFIKYQSELNPNIATTKGFFAYDAALGRNKTLEDYRDVEGVNFQDHVLRNGGISINNISLRGGTEQTKYSVSGSFTDISGTIINTGSKRYSGRVNLDQNISNKIKAGIAGNFSGFSTSGQVVNTGANSTTPTAYIMSRVWMYRPIAPKASVDLLEDDIDPDAVNNSDFRVNPFIDLENQHQVNLENVIDGNMFVTYDITKDLQFRSSAIVRLERDNNEAFFNSKTSQGGRSPSNLNGVNGFTRVNNRNSFTNENMLTFKKTFNDHSLTAFGLFSLNKINTNGEGYSSRFLPNENLGIDGLDEGTLYNAVSNSSRNALASYATRVEYGYKSKYLVTALFRADGSSKFVEPWGYFPGGAVAWNMHSEPFFSKLFPGVSNSKLRASYGSNGNNRVGDFDTDPRLTQIVDGYSFGNASPVGSVNISAVGNPDLKWERINIIDIGYELGLFKGRVNLEAGVYRKTTEDLLLNATLPPTTGYSSAYKNIGRLRNDGLELTLNTVNISNKNFSWESNFNISFNKNKVLELTRGQQSLNTNVAYVSQFNRQLYTAQIGQPAGLMVGYIWDGNYQYSDFDETSPGVYVLKPNVSTNGNARNAVFPGDIKYRDLNGDGTMNEADFAIIGRGQPVHTGGFSNNFNYKAFSLNVFFQWAYGNDIYNANRLLLEGNSNGFANINQFASYANRWSPENQTNENYRTRGQGPIGFFSSRVVEDGSYLRLKTVSFNYVVPAKLIQKAYLSSLSFNLAAQNLWTLTNYSGMDPEVSTRNPVLTPSYDYSSYPKSPTVAFGIKATF